MKKLVKILKSQLETILNENDNDKFFKKALTIAINIGEISGYKIFIDNCFAHYIKYKNINEFKECISDSIKVLDIALKYMNKTIKYNMEAILSAENIEDYQAIIFSKVMTMDLDDMITLKLIMNKWRKKIQGDEYEYTL